MPRFSLIPLWYRLTFGIDDFLTLSYTPIRGGDSYDSHNDGKTSDNDS